MIYPVLFDTDYPDSFFVMTHRQSLIVYIRINDATKNIGASGSLRVRIDHPFFEDWTAEDWSNRIETAASKSEFCRYVGYSSPTAEIEVVLRDGEDHITLMRRTAGQRIPVEVDIDKVHDAIYRKIRSVPVSGKSNTCRQAAVSDDYMLEIKCKRVGFTTKVGK
ncbi:hypothetical protein ASF70_12940 [Rhizobium sp. Leaf321]|uniref:hypothetical protein n=1 Tax=Rhizobium sp. Leaf321 TaxID=1736335 RepID=UPI000713F0F2|nr:hypothetical protein [Rhizobium sp. Leaf321]KQQ72430.1 hypothetical protein ASF70_12940 [Rhizobium sp. Leaf321]